MNWSPNWIKIKRRLTGMVVVICVGKHARLRLEREEFGAVIRQQMLLLPKGGSLRDHINRHPEHQYTSKQWGYYEFEEFYKQSEPVIAAAVGRLSTYLSKYERECLQQKLASYRDTKAHGTWMDKSFQDLANICASGRVYNPPKTRWQLARIELESFLEFSLPPSPCYEIGLKKETLDRWKSKLSFKFPKLWHHRKKI
jgi:hypothetical protein